jgi:uncharacterized protein YecE (DUF72 family)
MTILIGTAGWQIPRTSAQAFPSEGSTLQRYAAQFGAVEINSSFYRPHKPSTYARWAAATPDAFRFAVKAPRTLTHERRLADPAEPLDRFLSAIAHLGDKLGPLLVQLPPSLAFEPKTARAFFNLLRERFAGPVACEPRHPSWFMPEPDALLAEMRVARVAADPARAPGAATPGGWLGLGYWRLHGSPRLYYTPYGPERLEALARAVPAGPAPAWVMFDNTMSGAAAADALALQALSACTNRAEP